LAGATVHFGTFSSVFQSGALMSRLIALVAGALGLAGMLPSSEKLPSKASVQVPDTLTLTSARVTDSTVHIVLPRFRALQDSVEVRAAWINVRSDTLEVRVPALVILKEPVGALQLASRPGDPGLSFEFTMQTRDGRPQRCIAAGTIVHVSHTGTGGRVQLGPDGKMQCRSK
jgi:hypothetical protein